MANSDARKLLDSSVTFESFSEGFKDAFAKLMRPKDVEAGHVFIQEGQTIEEFYILESGILARYKSGENKTEDPPANHMAKMSIEDRRSLLLNDSILLDTVQGKGRVTGLLHNFSDHGVAYATILSQGPSKTWVVQGQAFREMLLENSSFGLELLNAMATRLRTESKISRAILGSSFAHHSNKNNNNKNKVLKVMCYDSTEWVRNGFQPAIEQFNKTLDHLEIQMAFTEERLSPQTATRAAGCQAVCTFVNDTANAEVLQSLSLINVQMIAQRAAGFDRIDTKAARTFGMTVARVPAYSPYAVAEMAISLLMAVNRKVTKASTRVKMANFTLDEGLMGIDIHGKTIAVMGTGKIGTILCNIVKGFGANLICYDVFESEAVKAAGGVYVSQEEVFRQADVIFLMMPLLPATKHTINMETLPKLKKGVILINTSRGALVDTQALLQGLSSGQISGVGMDVYENEQDYFFQDWSARQITDPNLVALLGNQHVVLTAHQAFFTREAVQKIVHTTLENLRDFALGKIGLEHPNNCIPTK